MANVVATADKAANIKINSMMRSLILRRIFLARRALIISVTVPLDAVDFADDGLGFFNYIGPVCESVFFRIVA
jgi:hypothetical protein